MAKATVRFVMCVCPSAWHNSALLEGFSLNFVCEYSPKICHENSSYIKSYNNNGTLHEDQFIFLSYLAQFFLELQTFQTNVLEKIKVHTSCSILFPENRTVDEVMWKNMVQPNATGENMALAHCMTDTQGYKHTLTICNTFCSFHCNNGCPNAHQCYVYSGKRRF